MTQIVNEVAWGTKGVEGAEGQGGIVGTVFATYITMRWQAATNHKPATKATKYYN